MGSPELMATQMEERSRQQAESWERFRGYGVMGLTFSSGHALAFRRITASSIGPAHSSIWHRDPAGIWNMYVDCHPDLSCPRYFGSGVDRVEMAEIEASWEGPMRLSVRVPDRGLQWGMRMSSDVRTRALSWVVSALPEKAWTWSNLLPAAGRLAGRTLGAGNLSLTGRAPNGQRFVVVPRGLFRIEAAAAVVEDQELGSVGPLSQQARLGDFWIPNRGIFATGSAGFEAVEPLGEPGAGEGGDRRER